MAGLKHDFVAAVAGVVLASASLALAEGAKPAAPSEPSTSQSSTSQPPAALTANMPQPVDCGSTTCFYFRIAMGAKSAETRANEAMNTINKFLGGKVGKVTTQVQGKNVRLLLNNELVALITPADATAEKEKTVALLAARWRKKLELAFEATKAQL